MKREYVCYSAAQNSRLLSGDGAAGQRTQADLSL